MSLRSIFAPSALASSLLLGPVALPCIAADGSFSIGIRTEGQKLLVIGHNSLRHDLVCEYAVGLRMGSLRPEGRHPSGVQELKMLQGQVLEISDETLTRIGQKGSILPKESVDHVLHSQEFRVEIIAAGLTQYGCRIKETMPPVEKDQSRPPFDKR